MMARPEIFHDGYWYCYANSTSMLLASIGESVSPRLIEALSGVGLGAFQTPNGLPFFSGFAGLPDQGISAALDMLGFACEDTSVDQAEPDPIDDLPKLLEQSAVILGPLDMQHLTYNPLRPLFPGVDHFVLALGMNDNMVRVHDPAGFAHALIGRADLKAAWRADTIAYKRGHYRSWSKPRRIRTMNQTELQQTAMAFFRTLYAEAEVLARQHKMKIDGALIRDWAETMARNGFNPAQLGHLTRFALPLGSKRAMDYASFFEPFMPGLSAIKREQAKEFGACLSHVVASNWHEAAASLQRLGDIEDQIGAQLR
jgi:hypothetical protein